MDPTQKLVKTRFPYQAIVDLDGYLWLNTCQKFYKRDTKIKINGCNYTDLHEHSYNKIDCIGKIKLFSDNGHCPFVLNEDNELHWIHLDNEKVYLICSNCPTDTRQFLIFYNWEYKQGKSKDLQAFILRDGNVQLFCENKMLQHLIFEHPIVTGDLLYSSDNCNDFKYFFIDSIGQVHKLFTKNSVLGVKLLCDSTHFKEKYGIIRKYHQDQSETKTVLTSYGHILVSESEKPFQPISELENIVNFTKIDEQMLVSIDSYGTVYMTRKDNPPKKLERKYCSISNSYFDSDTVLLLDEEDHVWGIEKDGTVNRLSCPKASLLSLNQPLRRNCKVAIK